MWIYDQLVCNVLIIVSAHIGDIILEHSSNQLLKAIADNCTHAIIGLLAWFIVTLNIRDSTRFQLFEIALCTFIASIIDLDHFCMAKSLHLKDAVSLNRRPFLHSSTLAAFITITLLTWAHVLKSVYLERFALIFFVAFATHHTRDAHRRGYWFHPFESTPPLSWCSYVVVTILIPYFVVLWMKYSKLSYRNSKNGSPLLIDI